MCSLTRHIGLTLWRRCWDIEQVACSLRYLAKSERSWCIAEAHDLSNSISVLFSRSKYWKTRRYLDKTCSKNQRKNGNLFNCDQLLMVLHITIKPCARYIWKEKTILYIISSSFYLVNHSSKIMITRVSYTSYLESTSWVKNSCKGQSTRYSRLMPSQPSRGTSREVSGWALGSPPV